MSIRVLIDLKAPSNVFRREIIYNFYAPNWVLLGANTLKRRLARPTAVLLVLLFAGAKLLPAQAPTSPAGAPQPQTSSMEGTWSGTLEVGSAALHLVLHVSREPDGSCKATLDSLDQGVYAIEASFVTCKESVFSFAVVSVGASYAGKISATHQTLEGNWSQSGAALPLSFHRQPASLGTKKPADAIADVEGLWQGRVESNGLRLRLQLRISHNQQRQLTATLDSIDQAVTGIPATKVAREATTLHFEIPAVSSVYDGEVNAAKNLIAGTWTQAGVAQKLDFKRSREVLELRRPQNPVKPYPYREEEVRFSNAKAEIALSGTLTLPSGAGPFPAALLIGGSGPQDRDESLAGHRPFLVLADYLSRKGIAVLRYDKRGIGKSSGDFVSATTLDFAADAESALAYLRTRKDIDPRKTGLIGHSEGGLVAPMLAAGSGEVAWIILLGSPGVAGEQNLLLQSEQIARASGMADEAIEKSLDFDRKAYALVAMEKDRTVLETRLKELVQASGMADSASPAEIQSQIHAMSSPWFRFLLAYDPATALQKTKCPVLVLNGERDLQVPAKQNLPAIQKALQDGGNKDFQATELPGLNHLFQHAQTGAPREYGAIEETFSPGALGLVSDWILKRSTP